MPAPPRAAFWHKPRKTTAGKAQAMHDIRAIRENPAAFDGPLPAGAAPMSSELLALDETRRATILAAETATAEQNGRQRTWAPPRRAGMTPGSSVLRALVAEKEGRYRPADGASRRGGCPSEGRAGG